MKILVLTDHKTHTASNSFYGIVNALFIHKNIESVTVASRGVNSNSRFFLGEMMNRLIGFTLKKEIEFGMIEKSEWVRSEFSLSPFDFVLLRLPFPIPLEFFPSLIERFTEKRIINRPSGIRLTSDKAFLNNFRQFTPPIQICNTLEEITQFSSLFPCVLKPRKGYGGAGLVKIENGLVWTGMQKGTFEEFSKTYSQNPISYLAMKYLKNVNQGDKRIFVVEGRILTSTIRYPKTGSWLCNVAQGGTSESSRPTQRETEIVEAISPILLEKGIFYYGLDTLVDDEDLRQISEINTVSPGGLTPAVQLEGRPLHRTFADIFQNYCSHLA